MLFIIIMYSETLMTHEHLHLEMVEFKAFIGLLFLSGVFKPNHEDVHSLFTTDGTGRDIFRGTMSM